MKRIILTILALTLLLSLVACKSTNYTDDKKVTDLADGIVTALNDGKTYSTAEADFLDSYFAKPDYVTESVIRFSTDGNDLNEFGIYHVSEGKAENMKALLTKYVTDFYDLYNANYLPEETPKLRDAEVKVFGNYVVYAMLNDADRENLFSSVESALKK